MKKLLTSAAAVLTAAAMVSCGSAKDTSSSAPAETASTAPASTAPASSAAETEQETTEPAPVSLYAAQDITSPAPRKTVTADGFADYVSNTFIASGNNSIVKKAKGYTYRAYFPVEEYGELEYCFYFSNTVDSTYSKGVDAYVGRSGGDYTVTSAFIADGGTSVEDEITNYQPVTFSGSETKAVSPDERYWSDPVTFDVPEGHYLVWEWTIEGENVPATSVSQLIKTGVDKNDGNGLQYCDDVPLPQLIGAKRDADLRVAAIGDSITQGCQTESMAFEFWAARIAQSLGSGKSFWNCGLGWSRTSDAAACGDWLERTKNADVVIVAFGTNDIISGEYGGNGGNSAAEIDAYLRTVLTELKDSGCSVIVFTAPPEDYTENLEAVRNEYNSILRETCEEYGIFCFDFASLLEDETDRSKAKYGGHPSGEGGAVVAEAFMQEYSDFLGV